MNIWDAIAAISSAVAAIAALVTVLYARGTVRESRVSRQVAQAAHREVLEEERASRNQMASEHQEQMAARVSAQDRETAFQRALQLERVATVVMRLIEAARAEHLEPPPILNPPQPFRATRIPALLARLRTAISAMNALGGPALHRTTELANEGYSPGSAAFTYVSKGIDALGEIEHALAEIGNTGSSAL